tara:strand:+ start:890 stop:2566 length:1677 start_codon:yes stop_codon:yes gene_type:complete
MKNYLGLFLLVFSAQSFAQLNSLSIESLTSQAENAFQANQAELAISLYSQLGELNPDNAEIWYRLSLVHQWNEDYAAAIQAGTRAFEAGYREPASMAYRLAQLSAMASRESTALSWLEISLDNGFDDRSAIYNDEAFSTFRNNPDFVQLSGHLENAGSIDRLTGLEFDLDYLVEEAQRMHPSPERPAFSAEFLQAVDDIREQLPELSNLQFYLEITKLVAMLNDGHSAIYIPDNNSPLELSLVSIPLKFYWFREGIFIVDGIGENAGYAGNQVLRIGSMDIDEVLDNLSVYRGLDNAMTWRWMGPQFYLGRAELLNTIGASESFENITLTLRDDSGNIEEVGFASGSHVIPRKLRVSPAMSGNVPLYLSNIDENFWIQALPASNALYFQFNQVRDSGQQTIADFSQQLAQRLGNEEILNLIIDVRHNNGGNNTLVEPLIKTLIAFEQVPGRKIYVITGRNTFSAAQNFINRIERWTDAVFIGEPSASSPNFIGEETGLLLPYSRIRGSISPLYWQDSNPGDERQWIAPDVPVAVTAADYFAGRDAALEYILGAIENNN